MTVPNFVSVVVLIGTCACASLSEAGLDEGAAAYRDSTFASFSQNYFARFSRDPNTTASTGEITIGPDWTISVCVDRDPLTSLMAEHLSEFLKERMALDLPVHEEESTDSGSPKTIFLDDRGEGEGGLLDSYTLRVDEDRVQVRGSNCRGVRDGVVHLVDRFGFRAAPILEIGKITQTPRLDLRVGAVPWMGSYRDVAFLGCNSVMLTAGRDTRKKAHSSFTALSTSDAIPELVHLQDPELLKQIVENARQARRYGLKTFLPLTLWDFYPGDAPIFENHPGLRGAEALHFVSQPPPGYLLCTEDPLMRRYLMESIRGMFEAIDLDGVLIIIGGENFQHCYMRPAGMEKGHTNCARCEKLGAETAVANLCNSMAEAARDINPEGLLVAWPYSANHFWSMDDDQSAFIAKLKPGTAILSEIEKDETVTKEGGVKKLIWDYSIDLIGPSARALRQVEACKARGIPIFFKSEPELAFEAPGLPYIPCMDRWFDRAEALASCGSDGAWVFPWFQPCYGTTSAEVYKYAWWAPSSGKNAVLAELAKRIAGPEAEALLRQAWSQVSEAVSWSPEQPPYFRGPYYLGPAHPMCADANADLPELFEAKGKFGDHVLSIPTGDTVHFGFYYRKMEQALRRAVDNIDAAAPLVPERCQLTFQNEASVTRWFYHTVRTHANFYESCLLRKFFSDFAEKKSPASEELAVAQTKYDRWCGLLEDEQANTLAALPVVEQDPRLDFRNGMGTALSNAPDLMNAKLNLLDHELNVFLPSVAEKCGIK